MGRIKTIARRTFLIGSAAIAGGVAFGTYMVKKTPDNPLSEKLPEGTAAFNPWVMIDENKITLIAPHADKGQGVNSLQAALIAEELDVEFGQFEISFGVPSAAYWNTAIADDVVPFMPTDDSFGANTTRTMMGSMLKVFGMQLTGGSTTVPDSYEKLRKAGAVARETLKKAASEQTGVSIDKLKTENGKVILPDGKSIAYTQLAAAASKIDPVEDVTLRDPSQWRMIGKPMKRVDITAKSTGTLPYGIDLEVEGMMYATVKANPRKGSKLNSYDASEAKNMRGVSKILEITNGVAIIADNTWRAIQAANAIEYDWGEAPYPAEQDQHWKEVAASFTEERLDEEWRNEGEVEQTISNGEPIDAEYKAPYVAHQPLEPLNAIIKVTDDRVDLWTGHQIQRIVLQKIAEVTGHEENQIHLHNQFMGGSFGHRLEFQHLIQTAEIGNQMRGTPIKMTYSREEDFTQDFTRQIAMSRGRGTVKEGRVEALDLQISSVSSSRSQSARMGFPASGPDTQIPAGAWNNPYKFDHVRVRGYATPELAPTSSWRSVGASTGGFFFDCFLDELIHKAGADPMEERIRLMAHERSRKVLEAVAEMSSWGGELAQNKGRGVAFVESFGVPVAKVVEVTNTDVGIKIDKVWIAVDVGKILDPINFENLVQGGVIFGLGHAINSQITYADGKAEQENFWDSEGMRMSQCPEIFVKGLENAEKIRGIGEPPVPAAAPALANAIFAATGKRLREMPFNKHIDFV